MGRYLNSSTSYVLYKGQTEQPYFVDKSQMLSELFPFLDSGNRTDFGVKSRSYTRRSPRTDKK